MRGPEDALLLVEALGEEAVTVAGGRGGGTPRMMAQTRSGAIRPWSTMESRRRSAPVGTARTSSRSPMAGSRGFQWMRAKLICRVSMERRNRPRRMIT